MVPFFDFLFYPHFLSNFTLHVFEGFLSFYVFIHSFIYFGYAGSSLQLPILKSLYKVSAYEI